MKNMKGMAHDPEMPTAELSPDQAFDLWLTVPKRKPDHAERELLARAENFYVPYGDVDLAVSSWGQGRPIILLHGWGGHRGQWSAFVPSLVEANLQVISFDAPAHGDTPGTQTNGFEMAAALEVVVQRVGVPQAILAHSLGTLVATIALQNGLQVEKLVFIGALRRLSDALTYYTQSLGLPQTIQKTLVRRMNDTFGADIWEKTALDIQLPRFAIPTLLFHDLDDETTPYQSSVALARALPSADLVTTRELGHRRILMDLQVIQSATEFITS